MRLPPAEYRAGSAVVEHGVLADIVAATPGPQDRDTDAMAAIAVHNEDKAARVGAPGGGRCD